MSDLLVLLLRVNLAVAAVIGVVMLLRCPVRRIFGPRIAYGLWTLVPLAAAAMLAPARVVVVSQPSLPLGAQAAISVADTGFAPPLPLPTGPDVAAVLGALWLCGVIIALANLVRAQTQFARAARRGSAGPAVVGILRPRIVTPTDFTWRYTPREQRVILAHEQTHIARQDSRINALVALARCINWFNPLIHVLAHCLRIDQELACDAQVVAAHPTARRSYAEAMLKTQLAGRPLPLGCYWLARSAHPLAERIGLLSRKVPGRATRTLGCAGVAALALGGAWAAWAARPAEVMIAPAPPLAVAEPALQVAEASFAVPAAVAPSAPDRTPARRTAPAQRAEPALMLPPEPAVLTPAPPPPADQGPAAAAAGRLLPPGFFGPAKVHAGAGWSQVEPGSAVRVLATMTDPEGIPLVTDLTAFGSQSRYRIGYIERNASRYKLFTRVEQHGDRLLVTAALNQSFQPMVSGSTELASGETGTIRLPNGLVATVTPTLRAETSAEIFEGNRSGDRHFVNVERVELL